ncbi:MAG: glycosyltransferase family 4 protein [Pirellulaceae bacterium]|nr:glycosyltransferase family 4 protein [Pirellulaceae bacterium]
MSRLRLVLVTRRFWPLVGGAEMVVANLADEFTQSGHEVRIVTARWEPHWPRELVHRDVPVFRLPNPPQRGWGTFRYMLALGRWLRTQRGTMDAVLVSMLKHDAYTAVGVLQGTRVPVLLRAEGGGSQGDCHWHRRGRFGRRIKRRCAAAEALIAPSEGIYAELRAEFPAERVHYIPNGVRVPPPRDAARQSAARRALAEVNYDLAVDNGAPVAVFTGRLHRAKGLRELVVAWARVVRQRPEARLWLVGEGPDREELYDLILDRDLRGRVIMPGAFDAVDEILQAADLFVLPSHEEGMSLALLEAMAAGLPVVATDIEGNRVLIRDRQEGLLVPPRNPDALAAAILRQLDQRILARAYAEAARKRVEEEYSLTRMAQRHVDLIRQAIRGKSSVDA